MKSPEESDNDIGIKNSTTATESPPQEAEARGTESSGAEDQNVYEFGSQDQSNLLNQLFQGWTGIFVMAAGVILPAILICSYIYACHERLTLLILKHPLESLLEMLLIAAIPIGNYLIWSSLTKCDYRSQIKRGILNGLALGSSSLVATVCAVAVCLQYPTRALDGTSYSAEVMIIGGIFLLAAIVAGFLLCEVKKTRITESGRIRAIAIATLGAIIAIAGFAGAEARAIMIKVAESMAISEDAGKQREGMNKPRWLNPRKELNMECANYKAIGLPGMFFKLDNVTLRQLYFQVTGEPFRDDKSANFSTMPDNYLQRHVVGKPIDGLSLHRSKMIGHINPKTLTSTVYWNFVFKNKSYYPQEARLEIGLPEGAVVSGMTVWKDGTAQGTMFKPTKANPGTVSWTTHGHESPGVVTDLGRGRILLHCYPVPSQDQLRAAVAVTIPAKLHEINQASLPLPKIIDANFSMKGDHRIRMISSDEISLTADKLKNAKMRNGQYVITGPVSGETISGAGLSLSLNRQASYGPISIFDRLGNKPRYVTQKIIKTPAEAPKRLLIVLDGSESVKPHLDNLKEVLSKLSSQIDTTLILASKQSKISDKDYTMKEALNQLTEKDFVGGQDNLESVIKASELAGEVKNGAVLWIHGPQPSFNKEIYILSPFQEKPNFYELALDNGVMDPNEFFKHHRDIGPFTPIARSSHPSDDLNRFLRKWTPGGFEYIVEYETTTTPQGELISQDSQIREVGALFAKERCAMYLSEGLMRQAVEEAVLHRIVTPVSLASTILTSGQQETSSLAEGMHNRSVHIVTANEDADNHRLRPQDTYSSSLRASRGPLHYSSNRAQRKEVLQGASNGTLGPQGGDATAIQGINTAGTVRVNNLANLEALLNMVASSIEILGLATGGLILASICFKAERESNSIFKSSWSTKLAVGLVIIAASLSTPGVINYFVASARDANLFS